MDAYNRCTNLGKKSCRYCCHLWSRPKTFQTSHVYAFRNNASFYGEVLLAPCPTPELEDHTLSAVLDSLFDIIAATLHIGDCSSIRHLSTCHAVVTGTHLSWLYCILWGFVITNYSEYVLSICIINTTAFFLICFIPRIIMKGTHHSLHLPLQILCFKSITIVCRVKRYV